MTVQDLIDKLGALEAPEAEVRMFWHSGDCEVGITSYNGIYYFEGGEDVL